MSLQSAVNQQLANKEWMSTGDVWVRPSEWPSLTPISTTETKVTGLVAVFPNDNLNYLSFVINTSTGQYNVDWGDGSSQNINSGVQANKQYTYSSVPGSITSYGYKIVTVTITPVTVGATFTTINLRVRPSALSAGVVTYAQPWLDLEFGSLGLITLRIGFNDGNCSFPYLQRLRWASKSTGMTSITDAFYYLSSAQVIEIDADMSNMTGLPSMFFYCKNLRFAPWMDTGNVTNTSYMFGLCDNLINVPAYNLNKVTTMQNMFQGCKRLKEIPLFNVANVQNWVSTFFDCVTLEKIPPLNLAGSTNLNSTFNNCYSLININLSNVNNVSNFAGCFANCNNLISVSLTGTPSVNFVATSLFSGCSELNNITIFNTSRATTMASMFSNCNKLQKLPNINGSNCTSFNSFCFNNYVLKDISGLDTTVLPATTFVSTFNSCRMLSSENIANINTSTATSVNNMFTNCPNITFIPNLNFQNVTSGGGIFISSGTGLESTPIMYSLARNGRFSTSYASCGMNKESLENMFANLGNAGAASQTITITSNPGADAALSKTSTWTNNSNVVTMANTVGVTVGTQITGNQMGNALAVTVNSNNTISLASYIDNNTFIAFANVQTTNLAANTRYWVSNRSESSGTYYYELSTSDGGNVITFTSGTANMFVNRVVTTVNTNSNVILSAWPSGNGTNATATTRVLNTNIATFRGFSVTG